MKMRKAILNRLVFFLISFLFILPSQAQNNVDRFILTFKHDRFPNLDGTWLLSKYTKRRISNPPLANEITTLERCNPRLPFEKRDFANKEVVVSAQGPDFFVVNAKHPITTEKYLDSYKNKEVEHQNFGFKAVLDPDNITYAYTLKLQDFMKNPNYSRQIWLNGKLNFEHISPKKIVAKGYETEYSPECRGFPLDEVEFVFTRGDKGDFGPERPEVFFEQPVYAADILPHLDSAKDRSGFKPSLNYRPYDSLKDESKKIKFKKKPAVPGLW